MHVIVYQTKEQRINRRIKMKPESIIAVFELVKSLKAQNIKFVHYFED
tara:strand:+ start:1916 stop:2059 length:144 start_codon:yes stop_codon:yes gene_type:complete